MKMTSQRIQEVIEEILSLYKENGSADYIGEPVSQIEHMSQTAMLAMKEGYDDEVVLAAFFHDIGHICSVREKKQDMGGYGTLDHEKAGAKFLKSRGFSTKITTLIENHVNAKRYLTFVFPEYYSSLSDASKKTLEFQGGVMSQKEAMEFEIFPFFEESIRLRKWDEQAKEQNMPLLEMQLFIDMAQQHLEER